MRRNKLKRILALLLSALLLTAGIAACAESTEEKGLRNGVVWGMTPEEVLECEGNPEGVEVEEIIDMLSGIAIPGVRISKFSTNYLGYIFWNNRLQLFCYDLDALSENDIDYLKGALCSVYGEDFSTDVTELTEIVASTGGETDTVYEGFVWKTQAVKIFLLRDSGYVYIYYCNPSILEEIQTTTYNVDGL